MNILTPARLIAVAAVVIAALSFGVASAGTGGPAGYPGAGGDRGSKHSKRCSQSKHQLRQNKRTAVAFYETAFNDKNPRLAVERYGGPKYIQHNPLADNGFDAFIAFVEDFTGQFPDVHVDIRRVIAECDHVVTHALLTGAVPVYGERGSKVVDIFRLNRRGKVVEHWDVLAQISETSANGNPEV